MQFSLLRWFSIFNLLAIVAVSTAVGLFLTTYLVGHMLMRDAEVSRDFIEGIVKIDKRLDNKENNRDGEIPKEAFTRLVDLLTNLPDVVRSNLYGRDHTILWSSDKSLVGQHFSDNDDLDRAFRGEIVAEWGTAAANTTKPEHIGLREKAARGEDGRFVEAYLPIHDASGAVVAVVEVYKLPRSLFAAIDQGVLFVWASAAIGGGILYFAFFCLVRRADRIIRNQRDRLIEAETFGAIGEMAAAVAHGIRNPLASIRSAAELADEEDAEGARECHRDIMAQADRLDRWVRELLIASRGGAFPVEDIDVHDLIEEALAGASVAIRHQNIEQIVSLGTVPVVRASRAPLVQALGSLVANAVEAMPTGGRLRIECRSGAGGILEIIVEDTGKGMSENIARDAFRPLFTGKPKGMGLGLSLARRIIERYSGRIELETIEGVGTRAVMILPAAQG